MIEPSFSRLLGYPHVDGTSSTQGIVKRRVSLLFTENDEIPEWKEIVHGGTNTNRDIQEIVLSALKDEAQKQREESRGQETGKIPHTLQKYQKISRKLVTR